MNIQWNFIKELTGAEDAPFFVIAGPCLVENENIPLQTAWELKRISEKLRLPLIFKASYRKANRTRFDSFQGIGDEKALRILEKVKQETLLPILTDIHESHEAAWAAEVVDILQIPAFLARQTALLSAAAKTGKIINIKKGQFMSAGTLLHAAEKVRQAGNEKILLTERGNFFGYNDLVVDFRNIPLMQRSGLPVVLDITHSVQRPNQSHGTGGAPQFIELLARAGAAIPVDAFFLETHPEPQNALSDSTNMLPLMQVKSLLNKLKEIAVLAHKLK